MTARYVAPLSFARLGEISARARRGSGAGAMETRQLLSLIRHMQDRIAEPARLLDWLQETGFGVIYNEAGEWEIGRPEGPALGRARSLHAAIAQARDRWNRYEASQERAAAQLAA